MGRLSITRHGSPQQVCPGSFAHLELMGGPSLVALHLIKSLLSPLSRAVLRLTFWDITHSGHVFMQLPLLNSAVSELQGIIPIRGSLT
jgi:hypothetical protein